VPVGLAVDQRPFETELLDGALELRSGGARVLRRKGGEAGIALRPLLHLPRQKIIGVLRQPDGRFRILFRLHAGRGGRENDEVDARLVHRLQPQLVEVGKASLDVGEHRVALGRPRDEFLGEFRRREMFFKRDFAGRARRPRLRAKRLRHRKPNASLDQVAPAEAHLCRKNEAAHAAISVILR